MKYKTIRIIIASVLVAVLSTATVFAGTVPSDVSGKSCEKAVEALTDKSIITGDTDGLFHPDSYLTRAQVCKMLAAAMKLYSESSAGSGFKDMDGYAWAEGYIKMMAEKGIATGYPDETFRPGENVTVAELTTFVMRACGVKDAELGGKWPENFITKAEEMGLYENCIDNPPEKRNEKATKAQAAVLIYNTLELIEKAWSSEDTAGKEEIKKSDYIYGKITFENAASEINGIKLAEDVRIYAYGKSADYSKDMVLPQTSVMNTQQRIKYINVSTNAFYYVKDKEVTEIILPTDCGFSGRVYGVINDSSIEDISSKKTVQELEVLAAGQKTLWDCKTYVFIFPSEIEAAIAEGRIAELTASKGEVSAVETKLDNMTGKRHVELGIPEGNATCEWKEVAGKDTAKKNIKLENGEYVPYKDAVSVYVMNDDRDGYVIGNVNSIKKGYSVRLYDVTDDDDDSADIIVVKP